MTKTELQLNDNQRRALIIELAQAVESEGDLELDDDDQVIISEGDDNGAYVQMWKWVPFSGTKLCKGEAGKHDDCEEGCPVWDKAVA